MDSVLYLDTDTLVLRPVEDIWKHFKQFDSLQLASMSPEGEESSITWYPRFARHPFAGTNGMNSGVMLMNLTRMRAFPWTEKILEAYQKYKLSITWGDQDLLNIIFHDHPGNFSNLYCLRIKAFPQWVSSEAHHLEACNLQFFVHASSHALSGRSTGSGC